MTRRSAPRVVVPTVIQDWEAELLAGWPPGSWQAHLIQRVASDRRMASAGNPRGVWHTLSRARTRGDWYDSFVEGEREDQYFVRHVHLPVNQRFAPLPSASDQAMRQFADACVSGAVAVLPGMPRKAAAEIRDDWKAVSVHARMLSRALRSLKDEAILERDVPTAMERVLREATSDGSAAGALHRALRQAAGVVIEHLPTEAKRSPIDLAGLLDDLADVAKKRMRERSDGPRKRSGVALDRSVVLASLIESVHNTYDQPLTDAIATAAEVVLDAAGTIDVKQVRDLRKQMLERGVIRPRVSTQSPST